MDMALTGGGYIRLDENTTLSEGSNQVTEGESDDASEAVVEAVDGLKAWVLDGVGTGFIEWIAGGDISFNFLIAVGSHRDIYRGEIGYFLAR